MKTIKNHQLCAKRPLRRWLGVILASFAILTSGTPSLGAASGGAQTQVKSNFRSYGWAAAGAIGLAAILATGAWYKRKGLLKLWNTWFSPSSTANPSGIASNQSNSAHPNESQKEEQSSSISKPPAPYLTKKDTDTESLHDIFPAEVVRMFLEHLPNSRKRQAVARVNHLWRFLVASFPSLSERVVCKSCTIYKPQCDPEPKSPKPRLHLSVNASPDWFNRLQGLKTEDEAIDIAISTILRNEQIVSLDISSLHPTTIKKILPKLANTPQITELQLSPSKVTRDVDTFIASLNSNPAIDSIRLTLWKNDIHLVEQLIRNAKTIKRWTIKGCASTYPDIDTAPLINAINDSPHIREVIIHKPSLDNADTIIKGLLPAIGQRKLRLIITRSNRVFTIKFYANTSTCFDAETLEKTYKDRVVFENPL